MIRQRGSFAGLAIGGTSGPSLSNIPEIKIPTLTPIQPPGPGNVGATTIQPPQTEFKADADPRLQHIYDEWGRMRTAMEQNRGVEQERAIGNIQDVGDRMVRDERERAFARGAGPGTGVSRMMTAKAQANALQAAQKTGSEMATAGMNASMAGLAGQGGAAGAIKSGMQGDINAQLGASGQAYQYAALNAAMQAAALDRAMQAQTQNANNQFRLLESIMGAYGRSPNLNAYTG